MLIRYIPHPKFYIGQDDCIFAIHWTKYCIFLWVNIYLMYMFRIVKIEVLNDICKTTH